MNYKKSVFDRAIDEIMDMLYTARNAHKERQETDDRIKIEGELSHELNVEGIILTGHEVMNTIKIKRYPHDITNETASALRGKKAKALLTPIKEIMSNDYYSDIEFIVSPLPPMPDVDEDDEALEDRFIRLDRERVEERLKQSKECPENLFEINKVQPRPFRFFFTPDDIFITFCERNLHPRYSVLFKEFHKYNNERIEITCEDLNYTDLNKKHGKIEHYENELMNEGLMYLVNKFCNKKYFVEKFHLPEVLEKLMIYGSHKQADEEFSFEDFGNEDDDIESVYYHEIYNDFHNKFPMKVIAQDFTKSVIEKAFDTVQKRLDGFCLYNYNDEVTPKNLMFDMNADIIKTVFSEYCDENNIYDSDLFKEQPTISKTKILDEAVKTYQLLFSIYYDIYHTQKIADNLFTKVQGKTSGDDLAKVKP